MSDSPYAPPAAVNTAVSPDKLPSAVDLVQDGLKQFMDDVGDFALAGLGITLVALGVALVMATLAIGCFLGGALGSGALSIAGAATDVDAIAGVSAFAGMLIMLATYLAFFLIVIFGTAVVSAPFSASLQRAVDEHLAGGRKVGFGSAFETAFKQPVKDIMATVGMSVAMVIGIFMFYIGALFAAFFLGWWPLAVHLDGLPVTQGASRAFGHTKDQLGWHLGVFGLGIAVGMIAQYIPVLGPMFAALYQVKAYRAAFPRPADPDILD